MWNTDVTSALLGGSLSAKVEALLMLRKEKLGNLNSQ
jgi:hypothetical protein